MKDIKIPFIVARKDGTKKKSFPYKQAKKLMIWESARPKKLPKIFEIDPDSDFMFHNGDIIKKPKKKPETEKK